MLRSSRQNPRENHHFQHNQQKTTRKRARAVAATARTVLTTAFVVGVSWRRFNYGDVPTAFITQPSSSSSSVATSNGSGDDFCNLLKVGISDGPLDVTSSQKQQRRRKMIHGFVSNSGHLSFLYNVLISMQLCSNITWTPVVFAMDMDVCRNLRNTSNILLATKDDDSTSDNGHDRVLSDEELRRNVAETVCIPYLDRHLSQLARDEPESVEQIENEIKKKITAATTTTNVSGTTQESTIRRYESTIGHNFFGWGSVEHKFLINVKLYAIRDILNCNHVVDAFISDTDIAFRDDPRPYFEVVDNNNNNNNSNNNNNGDGSDPQSVVASSSGDIIAQNDTTGQYKLSLNSGFMYWRNTPANRQLIDDMITTVPFWWVDQARVNWLLHNRSTPHTLLDAELFPNGNMMNHFWDKIEDKAVMIHANWNSKYFEKQQMLAKGRVWFLNDNITNL